MLPLVRGRFTNSPMLQNMLCNDAAEYAAEDFGDLFECFGMCSCPTLPKREIFGKILEKNQENQEKYTMIYIATLPSDEISDATDGKDYKE